MSGRLMNEKRFACTACGKCCYGILPLTLSEAIDGADLFPLAMSFTPVRQSEKHFKITTRLGTSLQIAKRQKIAVLVMPVAYIPSLMPCPHLTRGNLCSVHETKPLRCKTMPFYPYHEEDQQAAMLVPRKEWLCDTTAEAPVVYCERKIVDRTDFDAEREALLQDAPALRVYADKLLKINPSILGHLMKAAQGPMASRLFLSFSSFLRIDRRMSLSAFALKQHKVLEEWGRKTADDSSWAEYNTYYREAGAELACYLQPDVSEAKPLSKDIP